MSAGRLLPSQYRSFLRLLNTFNREQIPLLRVSNIAVATEYLDPRTSVRATFRSQQSLSPSSGSGLLARLEDQLKILQHAEDHTREARIFRLCICVLYRKFQLGTFGAWLTGKTLSLLRMQAFRTWQSLINRYGQVQLSPLTVCSAIEDAALALPAVASGEPAWSILDTLEEATGLNLSIRDICRKHVPMMPCLIHPALHLTPACFGQMRRMALKPHAAD